MRRLGRWVLALCIAAALSCGDMPPRPNGSTDGRQHTCGFVTEDGVTDHLTDYWARCGRSTP